MGNERDVIAGGRDRGGSSFSSLSMAPHWLRRPLLVSAAIVLTLTALPWFDGTPGPAPIKPPSPCVTAEVDAETQARLRARDDQRAQIRTVPPSYRNAARRAALFTEHRVPAEFFLALAYNRTLYGAMLSGAATRSYAARGPLQWDLDDFDAVAVSGYGDAARPLDSFLAVAEVLRRAGAADGDDAFSLSVLTGSTTDQARADAQAFDVLTRQAAPPRQRCRVLGST